MVNEICLTTDRTKKNIRHRIERISHENIYLIVKHPLVSLIYLMGRNISFNNLNYYTFVVDFSYSTKE